MLKETFRLAKTNRTNDDVFLFPLEVEWSFGASETIFPMWACLKIDDATCQRKAISQDESTRKRTTSFCFRKSMYQFVATKRRPNLEKQKTTNRDAKDTV
eukprot:3530239-Amphidinium_carterae.1